MPGASTNMHGITTATRCSAGSPSLNASRGRRRGTRDSLAKRLTKATIASEAGTITNNHSATRSQAESSARGAPCQSTSHAISAAVARPMAPR